MTDWRRHTCGSLCCLYVITYLLEKLFVDTWVVRRRLSDIGRGTVDPEVWTWQLIRESRWRFAGLMEDSPTLLGRKGFLQWEKHLW